MLSTFITMCLPWISSEHNSNGKINLPTFCLSRHCSSLPIDALQPLKYFIKCPFKSFQEWAHQCNVGKTAAAPAQAPGKRTLCQIICPMLFRIVITRMLCPIPDSQLLTKCQFFSKPLYIGQ